MLQSPLVPLALMAVYALVNVARVAWLRRHAGINAYVIDHHDPQHRFVASVFFAVGTALPLYFIAIAVFPAVEHGAGQLSWAVSDATRWIGLALMAFAIVWTAVAQANMWTSWRIGIPTDGTPPLRTGGAFTLSRNPIFLGMLAFVVGVTVWSPSAVTVALLIASYITLEIQIRSEETFLERAHGEAYRAYCRRVRRWF